MNNQTILSCENVVKTYQDGNLHVEVLKNLNFSINASESIAIVGQSGSGKSTLLHLLGGLDQPSSGTINLMGNDITKINAQKLGLLRNRHLGFVYQFHHLLPEFSAIENVMMPLLIAKKSKSEAYKEACEMLEKVGLKERLQHRPGELSGGERQRAAIARALVSRPDCLLADEPTGNLDKTNASNIFKLMLSLKNEFGTAIVVVTHDDDLARHFDKTLKMDDGVLKKPI